MDRHKDDPPLYGVNIVGQYECVINEENKYAPCSFFPYEGFWRTAFIARFSTGISMGILWGGLYRQLLTGIFHGGFSQGFMGFF